MKISETDQEKAIQALGLTAPRLTPDDIDAVIVGEDYHQFPGTVLTVCALKLRNGFTVTGESAPVSAANFNADIGREIARGNAREKLWALEGYLLRERLFRKPKPRIHVCGVSCHPGDDNCNGYCVGKAPHAQLIDA